MDNSIKKPSVSILMPAYNAARFIVPAIRSVLAQTYADFELIIINDGSRDDTAQLAASLNDPRLRLIENPVNLGLQKSLNRGIKEAAGEYIARIDADDEWIAADKLSKQIDFLNRHPDYVLCGTGAICIDRLGRELSRYLKPETDEEIRKTITGYNCFVHSSVVFRTATVLAVGLYPEDQDSRHAEDYDLWLRLGLAGKTYNFPSYDVNYRISGDSVSNQNRIAQLKNTIRVAQKYSRSYQKNRLANLIRNYARLIIHGYLKL